MNFSNRLVTLPLACRTAWLLAFLGFAFLAWFATPTNPKANDRHCHRCNLLDRCLRRLKHVHETASELHGDIHRHNRQHQADHQFHAYGELGHAHDHVARSECTAKKLSLVKFTRCRASFGGSLFS
jgi:hypothetical protein